MSINPLTNFSQIGAAASGSNSREGVADNFNMFLQLLTTQLQNQNPLEPLDTNEFTAQLVQFSSVEQQVRQNDQLETLNRLFSASASANAVSYIGNDITAASTINYLGDNGAKWQIAASRDGTATITVRDENGNAVRELTMDVADGTNEFHWDGQNDAGSQLPNGQYSIEVSIEDANGANVPFSTRMQGRVDGVDFSTGEPVLQVGSVYIPMSFVESVTNRYS